tara:strand:+ start:464 stop:802 length:339 start_codon:yes stop_codon:yes gene_type:complete
MSTNKSLLTNVVTHFVLDSFFQGHIGTCNEEKSSLTSEEVLTYLTDSLGYGTYGYVLEELKDYMGEDFVESTEVKLKPITAYALKGGEVIASEVVPTAKDLKGTMERFRGLG